VARAGSETVVICPELGAFGGRGGARDCEGWELPRRSQRGGSPV
jgi:hypothetical protein